MTAVAVPRSAIDRFCVATDLRSAVSAVRREMRLPLVVASKNATSWRMRLEKSLFLTRATTRYDAVLNRYERAAWKPPPKNATASRPNSAAFASFLGVVAQAQKKPGSS